MEVPDGSAGARPSKGDAWLTWDRAALAACDAVISAVDGAAESHGASHWNVSTSVLMWIA